MSDKLTIQRISERIQRYLEESCLGNEQKAMILQRLSDKYQPLSHLPSSQFQVFRTDDPSFQFVKLEYTPPKPEFLHKQTGLLELSSGSRLTPSSSKPNIHRLSSQLKVTCSAFPADRIKDDRRRKKQKIKQLLQKTAQCFVVLLGAINRALSHLVCLKLGKGKKFQAEAIYLNSFEGCLQDYRQKQKLAKSTQELIEVNLQLCDFLIEKVPLFQKKFINPSEQVPVPLPSKLFKPLFP